MSTIRLGRTLKSRTIAQTAWHRPLLGLAAFMAALAVLCLIARFLDSRELLGVNVWDKPAKFTLSVAIYSLTWSWLIGQLTRFRRTAWWAGTISAVLLAVEIAIIAGAAAMGDTSHFNVSTPLHSVMWGVMAASIAVVWAATLVVSALLLSTPLGDSARTLAIRLGAGVALIGMGLGMLMTGPTAEQLDNFQGIAGAHAVGVPDGGPGLPLLGWSTVAGDLRIPHFIGMHALQLIPLVLILLELGAGRIARLADVRVRSGLVWVGAATYGAVLWLVTWQALRGQSIIRPDAATLQAAAVIAVAAIVAAGLVLLLGGQRQERRQGRRSFQVVQEPLTRESGR
jgi:hypothetical protein